MASFFSGLLGMSEQELRFHVQRATVWTIAPVLSLFPALSPLLSAPSSPGFSPLPSVTDESLDLFPLPQPAQRLEGQSGGQTHAPSETVAFQLSTASLIPQSEVDEQKQQVLVCEQGLCGRGEALPQWEERERGSQQFCSRERFAGQVEALPQGEGEDWNLRCEGPYEEEELIESEAEAGLQAREAGSFAKLDGGCLAQVMRWMDDRTLQSCSLVCQEWLEASSFARTAMTLQGAPRIIALPTLLARFSRLHTLRIQDGPLQDLTLSESGPLESSSTAQECRAVVDDSAMMIIAQSCRCLRKLWLEHSSAVSDAGLLAVLKACPELSELRVSYCGGFTGKAFQGLSCKIEVLVLDSCDMLTNEGLLAAAMACPKLQSLSLLVDKDDASYSQGLEAAAKVCSGLTELMTHASGVTNETLLSIASSCPQLQTLSFGCEDLVTDQGIAAFFAGLPCLEILSLNNMRGLAHLPLFGPGRRLRKLQLAYGWSVPDIVLREVSAETSLEELLLLCCPKLTDETVGKIVSGCRSLKRLALFDNELITEESIRACLSSKGLRLDVGDCPGIKEVFEPVAECRERLDCFTM